MGLAGDPRDAIARQPTGSAALPSLALLHAAADRCLLAGSLAAMRLAGDVSVAAGLAFRAALAAMRPDLPSSRPARQRRPPPECSGARRGAARPRRRSRPAARRRPPRRRGRAAAARPRPAFSGATPLIELTSPPATVNEVTQPAGCEPAWAALSTLGQRRTDGCRHLAHPHVAGRAARSPAGAGTGVPAATDGTARTLGCDGSTRAGGSAVKTPPAIARSASWVE